VSHYLDPSPSISRREFTLEWALAMLAGVAITVSGCGSDSPSTPTPTPGGAGGASSDANDGVDHSSLAGRHVAERVTAASMRDSTEVSSLNVCRLL